MRKQIKAMIKMLAIQHNEAVFDMKFGPMTFHSIEWNRKNDEILLHHFKGNTDYEYPFNQLDKELQKDIYYHLLKITTP